MTAPAARPATGAAAIQESWTEDPGWDCAQALAMLLPAFALAWPGWPSPIARDYVTTELTAAGVATLLSAPAAALLAVRALGGLRLDAGAALAFLPFLALAAVAALLGIRAHGPGDGLERTRAFLWMGTGLVQLLCGTNLRGVGRATLAFGAMAVALLLLGFALADVDGHHAGALHNTGELSHAALPGALAGLALLAAGAAPIRWLGLVAYVLLLVHAARVPVLATLAAVIATTGLATLLALLRAEGRRAAPTLAAGALAGLIALGFALYGPRPAATEAPAVASPTAQSAGAGDLGGAAVRQRIWRRALGMALDAPVLGVGPGQFAVAFPPYRDPVEIELSTHGRALPIGSEVEHPHNEYVAILSETGLLGAVLWAGFVLLLVLRAARACAAPELSGLAFALGSLGVLGVAFFHGPLTFNPTASLLSFAFFGALLGGGARTVPRAVAGSAAVLACAVFLWLGLPRAARLVRHGLALASFAEDDSPSPYEVRAGLERALEACPDSITAWTLRAHYLGQVGADEDEVRAAWSEVLRIRPYRVEALIDLGRRHALAGEVTEARELFERAARLDPEHPALLLNRVRLELTAGELEAGLEWLERAEAAGRTDPLWLRDLGCELLCRGMDREARPVLDRADERFRGLDVQLSYQLAREYRAGGSRMAADGFDCLAQRLWAHEHAQNERWDDARRMLRQAHRISRDYVPGAGARIRMELAAAMWRSMRREEAREELAGLRPGTGDWQALPTWARETLEEMGWVPAE